MSQITEAIFGKKFDWDDELDAPLEAAYLPKQRVTTVVLHHPSTSLWRHDIWNTSFGNKDFGKGVRPDADVPVPHEMSKRQDFSREHAPENGEKIRLGEYTLGHTLGEGEFGKVKIGWKKAAGAARPQVAVKIIRREKLDTPGRLSKVHREILILKQLNHPNIVRVHEVVETKNTIGIILEYASGGELFDYILQQRYLKDKSAQRLFAQLISGVGYLHRNGIIHRDLKLENLLLDADKNIIITDFGFANTFDPRDLDSPEYHQHLEQRLDVYDNQQENKDLHDLQKKVKQTSKDRREPSYDNYEKFPNIAAPDEHTGHKRGDLMATSCGSPCYAAPELVVSEGLYSGTKCDSWSCGVILYAMTAGYLPFDDDPDNPEGDNINALYKYITSTPLMFPEYVTPHTRDLLKRILVPVPAARADLFEIARHSWLADYAHLVEGITSSIRIPPAAEYEKNKALKIPIKDFASVAGQLDPPTLSRGKSEGFTYTNRQTSDNHGDPGYKTSPGRTAIESPRAWKDKRNTVQIEYVKPAPPTTDEDLATQMDYHIEEEDADRPHSPAKDHAPLAVPSSAADVDVARRRQTSGNQPGTTRPETSSSITAPRLPSRGSYGQPSAAVVSTETATGTKPQYISKPRTLSGHLVMPPSVEDPAQKTNLSKSSHADGTANKPLRHRLSGRLVMPPAVGSPGQNIKGHKRSSTVSNLSEKLLPRRPKPDRSHPPTSMRPLDNDASASPPPSSRRSFGFLRKWSNSEINSQPTQSNQQEKLTSTARRFSLLSPHKKLDVNNNTASASGSSSAARRVADFFRRRR